jgi:hypothetical protein
MFFVVVLVLSLLIFIGVLYLSMTQFSKTDNGLSSGITTRVALLTAGLSAINIWNTPVKPFEIEGRKIMPPYLLYVFSYFVIGLVSFFIIFSEEPAYSIISIILVIYVQSVNTRYNCNYPFVVPVLLFILTLIFFSDRTEILDLCDWFRNLFNFKLNDASSIESYIISNDTIFTQPIILATIIGVTSFFLMRHSCIYYKNYMSYTDLPIETVLNPNNNGAENISRFVGNLKSY